MEQYKCVSCREEATEGFAIGRICYYCLEEAVVYINKEIRKKEEEEK